MYHIENKWVENCWDKYIDIYNNTKELPFIREIISGRLEYEKFIFYIQQDALYINSFTKVLAKLAKRIDNQKLKTYFETFVEENMEQEKELHKSYIENFKLEEIRPTKTCLSFINFNENLAQSSSVEIAIAGILPCFIVYQQLGIHIFQNHIKQNNPFIKWINTYAGVEHADSVIKIREACEFYANKTSTEGREQMYKSYEEGCKLDQKFWISCYEMR